MQISAAAVKELRERSGAGMMECKNALVATEGDIEAALEHLRKSGAAKAAKKAGRIAAEGSVVIAEGAGVAVLVEVNSETDFSANDDNFIAFAQAVARTVHAPLAPAYWLPARLTSTPWVPQRSMAVRSR